MNIVIKELSTKATLQEFLLTLLNDVHQYFKAAPPMSQDKAIASLQTILLKVQKEFPLIASVPNIAKRITKDIKQKVAERTDKSLERRKAQGIKSFIEGIQIQQEGFGRSASEENQQNIQNWVKKTLLQCINQLKEEIREADDLTVESLSSKLGRVASSTEKLPHLLFVDSFLSNHQAVSNLSGYVVKKVVSEVLDKNQISFEEGAKQLRGARLLVLTADAVLRNGGILCQSGGLMMAVAARELGVPVVVVSRSYCLWQQVMSGQSALVWLTSGRSWFPDEEETSFRVCVGKRFDYVGPQLVEGLIGETRGWESKSIVQIFQDYYN